MENKPREVLNFAKLQKGRTPVMSPPSSYSVTKNDLQRALESSDLRSLRSYSQYFYLVSGEYRRLVEYYGKLFLQDFIIIPRVSEKEIFNPKFEKAHAKVNSYLKNSSVAETNMDISTIVVRDGSFFGYEREVGGTITMQQLPSEYCRSRYKYKGVYLIEFDMSYFNTFRTDLEKKEAFDSYPPEFKTLYNAYQRDTTINRWGLLDPSKTRAHMMWEGVPLLAPILLDIIELSYYKNLEKVKSNLDLYKLLVQKIPVDKEGNITLMLPEIESLHDNFRQMITNVNIDVLTTPADVELIDLVDSSDKVNSDAQKAKNFVYDAAGTSSVLFNSGVGTGSIGLDASIKTDMSLMSPLLRQFEKWYELKLETISGKFDFGFFILPTTYLNLKEMHALYKEGAANGFPTKLMEASCMGLKTYDIDGMLNYENLFLNLPERMIPMSSTYTGGGEESSEGGRPKSEEPLSDEGEKTRDGDKNANRA